MDSSLKDLVDFIDAIAIKCPEMDTLALHPTAAAKLGLTGDDLIHNGRRYKVEIQQHVNPSIKSLYNSKSGLVILPPLEAQDDDKA